MDSKNPISEFVARVNNFLRHLKIVKAPFQWYGGDSSLGISVQREYQGNDPNDKIKVVFSFSEPCEVVASSNLMLLVSDEKSGMLYRTGRLQRGKDNPLEIFCNINWLPKGRGITLVIHASDVE